MCTWTGGDLVIAYPTSSSAKAVCISLATARFETAKSVSGMIIKTTASLATVVCPCVTQAVKISSVEVTNGLCGQPTAAKSPCTRWLLKDLVCSAKLCILEIGCYTVHAPEGRRELLQEILFALQTSAVLFLMGIYVSKKGSVP